MQYHGMIPLTQTMECKPDTITPFAENQEAKELGCASPDSSGYKLSIKKETGCGSPGGYQGDGKTVPRRLCAVCEGLATGYHYGVPSCEACKAFFKRTVQRNMSYTCSEDGHCDVFHGKRRTCQACRYDKCLQSGMMINGVRLNRSKGGRQEYRRRPDEQGFTPVSSGKRPRKDNARSSEFCKRLLEIEPGVLQISLPDGEWVSSEQIAGGAKRTPIQKIWMERMAEVADRALTTTVQWAKKIPGFDKLCLNDQMALLCNSWMEILLANVVYRSTLLPTSIYFADGFIVTEEMSKGTERGPLIYNQITNIVERLRELNVSRGIVVLLKAAILLNSGPSLANRLPVKSPDEVRELQTQVYDALHYRIHQEHPGDDPRLVYRLLMILPLIKDVAVTVASLVWVHFNEEQVFMQELLSEVVQPIIRTKSRLVAPCCRAGHDHPSQAEGPVEANRINNTVAVSDQNMSDKTQPYDRVLFSDQPSCT